MKIGIDIDGVIAKNLDINQLHRGNDEEIYRNLPFDESSRKLLETLQQNFKIYFITARDQEFQRVTEEWLRKNKISYDKIFFNPYDDWRLSPEYKTGVVQRESVAILIDDLPQNINQINEETDCRGVLFSNWREIHNEISKLFSVSKKGVVGE